MSGVGIATSEVHVWRAPLDLPRATLATLLNTLTQDELARLEGVGRRLDRDRQAAARGWLRLLLARYAERPPAMLRFERQACGKPYLAEPALSWLRFNVSHSADLELIAIARRREVGVDLERIDPGFPVAQVAAFAFPDAERELVGRQAPALSAPVFFARWARHEASAKAGGEGIAERRDVAESDRWTVIDIDVGPGFAAALAVERGPNRIVHRTMAWASRRASGDTHPPNIHRPILGDPPAQRHAQRGLQREPLGPGRFKHTGLPATPMNVIRPPQNTDSLNCIGVYELRDGKLRSGWQHDRPPIVTPAARSSQ